MVPWDAGHWRLSAPPSTPAHPEYKNFVQVATVFMTHFAIVGHTMGMKVMNDLSIMFTSRFQIRLSGS